MQRMEDPGEDGSAVLHFGVGSDGLAGRLMALVLHLYSRDPQSTAKAAKLSSRLEVSPGCQTLSPESDRARYRSPTVQANPGCQALRAKPECARLLGRATRLCVSE